MTQNAINQRIRELAEDEKNLSTFAKKIGRSYGVVSNMFSRGSTPSLEMALDVASAYKDKVSLLWLYGWKNTGMVEAIKAGFSLKWVQLQAGHHSLEQTNQYLNKIGFVHLDEDLGKFPSF